MDTFSILDSVYVERYMGWPFDNIEEYNRSNLLNKVMLLKDKKLLLVFGTADGLLQLLFAIYNFNESSVIK